METYDDPNAETPLTMAEEPAAYYGAAQQTAPSRLLPKQSTPPKQKRLTREAFMALEAQAHESATFELHEGQLVAMPRGSVNHYRIISNLCLHIGAQFNPDSTCQVLPDGVMLEIVGRESYLCPDISVTCDPTDDDEDYIRKPVLLAEVLSESTEKLDRGKKKDLYFSIPSLRYYLLVAQTEPHIELYARAASEGPVSWRMYKGLDAVVPLPLLHAELALLKVYKNVGFAEENQHSS